MTDDFTIKTILELKLAEDAVKDAEKALRVARDGLRHLQQGRAHIVPLKKPSLWQLFRCKRGRHPPDQLQNRDFPTGQIQCRLCKRWVDDDVAP